MGCLVFRLWEQDGRHRQIHWGLVPPHFKASHVAALLKQNNSLGGNEGSYWAKNQTNPLLSNLFWLISIKSFIVKALSNCLMKTSPFARNRNKIFFINKMNLRSSNLSIGENDLNQAWASPLFAGPKFWKRNWNTKTILLLFLYFFSVLISRAQNWRQARQEVPVHA